MFGFRPLHRTLPACVRDITAEKPQVRLSAISDLVRHASRDDDARRTAVPLFEKALTDTVGGVRSAAAVALADIKAHEALPALLVAMEDADAHARQMAVNALGEIGDARAAPRLRRALSDKRPDMRYQAVIACARLAHDDIEEVVSVLARALKDEDDSVRYIALRIAEEHATLPSGETSETSAAQKALLSLAPRAVELLEGEEKHVALAAAIFLAKLGREEGKALLLGVIEGTAKALGRDKEDEREAVEIAGALGLREMIPALERRAWGVTRVVRDTCAFHAKIALARMGHERAVKEILKDLESSKRLVKEAAIVAAGRGKVREARGVIERMTGVDEEIVRVALEGMGE